MHSIQIDITPDIVSHVNYKTDEIIRNGQSRGRTRSTIYTHSMNGYLAELGVSKILGAEFNSTQNHNPRDPHSFAYDLILPDGKTIEVKTINENNSPAGYLNLNRDPFKKSGLKYGFYPEVDTAIRYDHLIEYIVFCANKEGCIELLYMYHMGEFVNAIKESFRTTPNSNSTHFIYGDKKNSLNLLIK